MIDPLRHQDSRVMHDNKRSTPDWVKHAIFYQIFPDSFARSSRMPPPPNARPWDSEPDGKGFFGGDLYGVVEKLDYLSGLGVNAIFLNPVFQAAPYHRYHTHDYFKVDPLLGGDEALRCLLDAAHARGMRVILDGVFNHCGRGLYQFNHILENGADSPFLDWFSVYGFPLNAYDQRVPPNYAAWRNVHALPKFNIRNPAVRQFLLDVASFWVDRGVDGWRLDGPDEIKDDEFWRSFRSVVKRANPDAFISGEIWSYEDERTAVRWLQGDMFDGITNFGFRAACLGFFLADKERRDDHIPPLDAISFGDWIDRLLVRFHPEIVGAQMNLLDNHDTASFMGLAEGDKRLLRLAALLQMTFPGAPCIYFGDEIGLAGLKDPEVRRTMPWGDAAQWDGEMLGYFRRLTAIRRRYCALRIGTFARLFAQKRVYGFVREAEVDGKPERLLVLLNSGDGDFAVDLPVGRFEEGAEFLDVLGGAPYRIRDGRLTGAPVPAKTGIILLEQPRRAP